MPNRIIKESICTSENIDQLSSFQETVFYRLLVNCDDYGCFDARVKVVASRLFPLKVIRPAEIVKALNRLAETGLIILYEAKGKPYLKVVKWADHQRVRVSKHKYPMPEDGTACGELPQVAASCGEMRPESNPIQSESNPNPNPNPTRERGETDSNDQFDRFWERYPNKVAKQDALKAWKKIRMNGELFKEIMSGLDRWLASDEWYRDNGRFIPHPATWLNGQRWNDEVKRHVPNGTGPGKRVAAQEYVQRDYSGVNDNILAGFDADMRRFKETGEID